MFILRWVSRLLGLFLIGLILVFAAGLRFNPLALQPTEIVMTVALLASLAGMVVLWWREGLGGAVSLAGIALFYAINFAASGRFPGDWVFPLFFLPGILALACWWHDQRNRPAALKH